MEEERNYTVYMHVCKGNSKTYVGITQQEVERRWRRGAGYKDNTYFKNAIQKYGWDNFEHIILFQNKTKKEAEGLEILFVDVLLSNNRSYGYNISNGGDSIGKHSDESKLKMTLSKLGTKHTTKTKEMFSKMRKGGKNANAKKVYCDGIIFGTITECSNFFHVKRQSMNSWLNGKRAMPKDFFDKGLCYLNKDYNVRVQGELVNKTNAKKVICDNVIYASLVEVSLFYNVNYGTIGDWLRGKNRMPQKFVDLGLKYLDSDIIIDPQIGHKGSHNGNSKKIICDGVVYSCIRECAEVYGLQRRLLNDWLLKPHRQPQEFKDMGLAYYIEENNEESQ